jgi:hypothetical protein
MGIRVVTLMIDAPNNGPPTLAGTLKWKQQYNLVDVSVMSDAGFSLVSGGSVGTPQITYVDPRTMKVIFVQQGYSGDYSGLENLAKANGG